MKRIALVAALVVLCAGAWAETPAEILIVPPYPAATPWKNIMDKSDASMVMREWIPSDQNENDIKDILTEQHFTGMKDQSPAVFIKGMFERVSAACLSLRVNGPVEHTENGYPIAYAQIYCAGQKGTAKDVDIFLKAIAGKKAFYVVQYEIRRPADTGGEPGITHFASLEQANAMLERQRAANDYLSSKVELCPPASGTDTCPKAATNQETEPAKKPEEPAPTPSAGKYDVSKSFGVVPGTTTKDDIQGKLGRPTMETHAKDGRSTMLYTLQSGYIVVFLFDKSNVLISTSAYQDKG